MMLADMAGRLHGTQSSLPAVASTLSALTVFIFPAVAAAILCTVCRWSERLRRRQPLLVPSTQHTREPSLHTVALLTVL